MLLCVLNRTKFKLKLVRYKKGKKSKTWHINPGEEAIFPIRPGREEMYKASCKHGTIAFARKKNGEYVFSKNEAIKINPLVSVNNAEAIEIAQT